ncbi:MAG: alpha/beta hydrolase fold domain-containing protein [Ilumatobacteraceae bacterium]|nr:alpha/beta hydrolase fold domain-containing protein [Ilumatobacteraceae bacterium]
MIAGVVLFPGAGTSASHQSLIAIETAINSASTKIKVARCDFEYRKAGKNFPDKTPVLIETVRKAITQAAHDWGCKTNQIVIGGRSMGGRMCSMAVANTENELEVAGLVCVCYPLHPPKQPSKLRSEHLPRVTAPTLFISGTRDEFGTVEELTAATLPMNNKKHVWIDGARHDLKNRDAEVGEIIANWIVDL